MLNFGISAGAVVMAIIGWLWNAWQRESFGEHKRRLGEVEKGLTEIRAEVSEARRVLTTHTTEISHITGSLDSIETKLDRLLERAAGRGSIHNDGGGP